MTIVEFDGYYAESPQCFMCGRSIDEVEDMGRDLREDIRKHPWCSTGDYDDPGCKEAIEIMKEQEGRDTYPGSGRVDRDQQTFGSYK